MFADRREAGAALAQKLVGYRGKDAVVLALPRGGVIVGSMVAEALSLPLDIIAVRKIGHPLSREYAIGAVDEDGVMIVNEQEAAGTDQIWLAQEVERERTEAVRRSTEYRIGRKRVAIEKKIAILVDDGIATGLTMRLAVRSVLARKPETIIVAVPVAPLESLEVLRRDGADEIIVLEPPESFLGAVGAHYVSFGQVGDDEVVRAMRVVPKNA